MWLLIIIALVIILVIVWRLYSVKPDTCLVFTGGLGSGKSLVSCQWAKRLLNKNRRKVKWHNFKEKVFHRNRSEYWDRPLLYSSIPIRISKKEWSTPLADGIPCLKEKVVLRSVVFIDEVSLYIDQMTTKFENSDNLEEWATLFRHYTQGGYLVLNTQNTSKVNFHLRYCLNRGYNLAEWRHIWRIYWVKIRDISLIEDEKSVATDDLTKDYRIYIGWLPFLREYDTYVYSERVKNVPLNKTKPSKRYKTNYIARLPEKKIYPNLQLDDSSFKEPAARLERRVSGADPKQGR